MKKLLSLLVMGLFLGSAFATYTNTSSEWLSPEYKDLNFHATLQDDGTVAMTWAPFDTPSGHSWTYWKVMRSQTNDNPVYKVDQYIKYSSDRGFTRYSDKNPPLGTNYYRICAITKASDGYHRYCSNNVDKLTIENKYEEKYEDYKVCTMEYAPVCGVDGKTYGNKCTAGNVKIVYEGECKTEPVKPIYDYNLSDSMKEKIEALVDNFMEKLGDRFTDIENKKDTLEIIIEKVDDIKVSSSMYSIIEYLKEKLQEQLTILTLEGLLDL